jgi:predicted phage gp36 major capsid-like protein
MNNGSIKEDVKNAFNEFMDAFANFKEANDARVAQLEKRLSVDVVLEEKVERLQKEVSELYVKQLDPEVVSETEEEQYNREYTEAFEKYIRAGDERALNLAQSKKYGEHAYMESGGYIVSDPIEFAINKKLRQGTGLRSVATIVREGPDRIPVANKKKYDSPSFSELYAMPAATPSLLEDTAVDISAWIAQEAVSEFLEQEDKVFILGNGNANSPKGLLNYGIVPENAWSEGKFGFVPCFYNTTPDIKSNDALVNLVYTLRVGLRKDAAWLMNTPTQSSILRIKDGSGTYVWKEPLVAGGKATIMHYPIVESPNMPNVGYSDSTPIAFGNFKQGFRVRDLGRSLMLRDRFSAKPYTLFYTTKLVGCDVLDFHAIKFLKMVKV